MKSDVVDTVINADVLKWGNTSAFWWLLAVIIFVAVFFISDFYFLKRYQQKLGQKIYSYLAQAVSTPLRRLQVLLQAIGLVFIIFALARPQMGASQQEITSEGVELMILADVSESMMSEDVKPSRLVQMKVELSKLLDLMPGNKVGIIAFAGSSSLLCPLTTDPNALKMYIESLDTNSVSTQGTNFEMALDYAKDAFEKGGVTQDNNTRTTRVILIASDGEDQEKGALEAAKRLSDSGIKIYTMAYGTEKGGAIPVRDYTGNMTGYKKDSSGQIIQTTVKGDFLKQLADTGGGHFYYASFGGDHLRKFVNDIANLEKTQFQSSHIIQYDEKFTWPLLVGFILLLISLFISDRRRHLTAWRGRYEV